MSALHDILRSLPHPHITAYTTICILGKLGGRNHHLQHEPPQLACQSGGDGLQVLLSFDGRFEAIDITAKSIRHVHPAYRAQSCEVLKSAMTIIVHKVRIQLSPPVLPHPNM